MKKTYSFALLAAVVCCNSLFAQTISLVKDINPAGHSFPYSLVKLDNLVYFIANDGVHGEELWKTNGKERKTELAFDFNPGSAGCNPQFIYEYKNALYFAANNGSSGMQLWKSDGTLQGTVQLTNAANSTTNPSGDFSITGYKGNVYFSFNDGVHGNELWITDGTMQGTHIVKDFTQGIAETSPVNFFVFKDKLFFIGEAPIDTRALYITDGTEQGTMEFFNCNEEGCRYPTVLDDQLFFVSDDSIFSHPNNELYISDGTIEGTHLFLEINPNFIGVTGEMVAAGNKLFFSGDNGEKGSELWVSDGTIAGTKMVKDLRKGAKGSSPDNITPYGGKVVFGAYLKNALGVFFISDGTEQGTILLDTLIPSLATTEISYAIMDGKLYFSGYKSSATGYELCVTDGTPDGTGLFADINNGIFSSSPSSFLHYHNGFLFSANDDVLKTELFKLEPAVQDVFFSKNELLQLAWKSFSHL